MPLLYASGHEVDNAMTYMSWHPLLTQVFLVVSCKTMQLARQSRACEGDSGVI